MLEKTLKKGEIPTVEQVQDIVEKTLIEEGHAKTAKAYILYRKQHQDIREIGGLLKDIDIVDGYLSMMDWKVQENSNMAYSLQGLNVYATENIISHYWLNKIYPPEIGEAHTKGSYHIHDLGTLGAYCVGWDLKDLLLLGFRGVSGKIESKPAKHFSTALMQVVNYLYTLQGEAAGAQALSNFDSLLAPFIRYDGLSYKDVKQEMQKFLFNMNVPTRVGFQSPFSNCTLDLTVPKYMMDEPVIIGGELKDDTYSDFVDEIGMFNRAFAEVMYEGDAKGRPFTFPIPTYNITKNFNWDDDSLDPIWDMTAKYGAPYFSNFINSDMKPEDARSMCCRLRLDNRELRKRGGGLFGANPKTGCYDEKTEVLTENGWKFFKDVNKNEKVFTLTKNNEIKLHKPIRFFEYDYDNEMYHFKTRSLDLLVTPNHRMLVDNTWTKERKFVEAKDFKPNTHRIPKRGIWNCSKKKFFELPPVSILGGSGPTSRFSDEEIEDIKLEKRNGKSIYQLAKKYNCNPVTIHNICKNSKYGNRERVRVRYETSPLKIKIDNWLKFFGFWLAEGSTDNEKIAKSHGYRTVISQVNKQKRKEIMKVLDSLPFNYTLEDETYFVICNKQLWSYLRQFGDKYTKFIPREIKELDRKKLKILFDWMVKRDGYIRKSNGQINYWTASKKLADDIQEIVMKIGWLATIKAENRNVSNIKGRKVTSGTVYTIGVHRKSKHFRLRENSIFKKHYKGKVYCLEVPNHTLYVRRNGKPCWCGNSIGVVTINMPQIGYLSKDDNEFFERLDKLMELAKQSLEIKREVIENLTFSGLHPYSRFYLSDVKKTFGEYWKNHFSTIGLIGMNDALLNFMNKSIGDKEGKEFAEKVLDHMRERMADFQQETGNIFNLEATPGEGSLAPDENVLVSQSDPRFEEIGPLIDNYLEKNKDKIQMVGTSEVLKIPYGEMFTYGFSRKNQKIKRYPVTALVRHRGKSMYSITTASGRSIKVTGQHSVFTLNSEGIPKEVLVSDLSVGAHIAVPKKIEIEATNEEFNLIELFKKSSFNKYLYGIFPISYIERLIADDDVKKWCNKHYKFKWSSVKSLWRKRKIIPLKLIYDLNIKIDREILISSKIFYRYSKNTKPINAIIPISEDFGFIVGCLLSEGWLAERIEFSNTDKNFADKFFKSVEKIFGNESVHIAYYKRKKPRKIRYVVTLSKSIGLFFREIGLQGKSNEKQVPNFIFSSNLDCVTGLLRGYYLGDGSFYKNIEKNDYSVDLYSSSKKLIDGLNLLFLRFGILTKIREDKKSKYNSRWNDNYCISITGAENLEIFFANILKEKSQLGKIHSGGYTISEIPKIIKQIMQRHGIKPSDLNICKDSINKNIRINRISNQYLHEIIQKLSNSIKEKDEALDQLKILATSDIYWDKVKEIKRLKPTRYVYDFEVDVKDDFVNNFLGGSGLVCLHNTSYRLPKIDKANYPDIRIYNQEKYNGGRRGEVEPYYTNSTQLPVGYTSDVFEALDLQDSLQSRYTGGTVLHVFLGEDSPSPEAAKKLIRKIAENYTLPYYTLTPTFSVCPDHGYIAGEHQTCPTCEAQKKTTACEVYSRVVGYLRPVNQWNRGKQQEFRDRKMFNTMEKKTRVAVAK
jgi:anaerobic ribonucleoside-triphosphate reductase